MLLIIFLLNQTSTQNRFSVSTNICLEVCRKCIALFQKTSGPFKNPKPSFKLRTVILFLTFSKTPLMASSLISSTFSSIYRRSIKRHHQLLPTSLRALSTSFTNTTASFDWSDDDDSSENPKRKNISPSNLPPPYDPFDKKPAIRNPKDPSNLQEVFHNMRTEGLTNSAIKMFDALSKDGLTHEALDLFAVIKDKGTMPDVVAHTAVIEAYAEAGGHSKEAIRAFERMLTCGVLPNVYTYGVLIKGLSRDGKMEEARRYVMEMMGKGMRVNVGVGCAVVEGYVREGRMEEGKEVVDEMKRMGFVVKEEEVREVLGKKRGVFRKAMSLFFD